MSVDTYSSLSLIYSHLMRSIRYDKWAAYILLLFEESLLPKKSIVLEIACGDGKIAHELKSKFKKYFISDLSFSMLVNQNSELNKICCNMTELPFKEKMSFVYSTFDSVNYLLTAKIFKKMLSSVSACLKDNGVLTFDVSLENNSIKHERFLNRKGTVDGVKFIQYSKYDREKKIHFNRFDITLANGKTVKEIHKQKIYSFDEYFEMIEKSDFYVEGCYNIFTFDNASPKTERAQFVLRKRRNHALI